MKITDILSHLEAFANPLLQEEYDNAGLITGSADWTCTGAVISLDVTEEVIEEAVEKNCNLVISHHPIVFRSLKKMSGQDYTTRAVIAAIKNNVAIYAIHTNLDNVTGGVNGKIAEKLGLVNCTILAPKKGVLKKIFVFVPRQEAEQVRMAVFEAGGGQINHYSECSFNTPGIGTFKGGPGTNPFVGEPGKLREEEEIRIEIIYPFYLERQLIAAMVAAHPYEEVAYDIVAVENSHPAIGSGLLGELIEPMDERSFLKKVLEAFQVGVVRHTPLLRKPVRKVALCGGAGSFLISKALGAGADFFITADVKYHDFFDAGGSLVVADVGHYESEQYTIDLIAGILQEKFPTFAALKTAVKTNPVNYFLG